MDDGWDDSGQDSLESQLSLAQTARESSTSRLTYAGFLHLLQNLGIHPHSVRSYRFGIPVGVGANFAVYRQRVRPTDFEALSLSVTPNGCPPFYRPLLDINEVIAIKRVRIRDVTGSLEISDQGQLHAICQEIQALVHPGIRDHDSIVKLQAIIWENGIGSGNESEFPMWPALVMEYCETTLAHYQLNNPPLVDIQKSWVGSKIGEGLDAIHSANIFHGDLKSENVLIKLRENGIVQPKLADFGCSVIVKNEEDKAKYWVGGTELWRAPECPSYFDTTDQVAATDFYSFGLLLLRILADGRNPFEEFGLIPSNWTEKEKLSAIKLMKETDRLYALLVDVLEKAPQLVTISAVANMLIADPARRMDAIENSMNTLRDQIPETLTNLQTQAGEIETNQELMEDLSKTLHNAVIQSQDSVASSDENDASQDFDAFSLLSYLTESSFIPDYRALSRIPRNATLNAATQAKLTDELLSSLNEGVNDACPQRCEECCSFGALDLGNFSLTADILVERLQNHLKQSANTHRCLKTFQIAPLVDRFPISASFQGVSSVASRKWAATFQLFLSAATGFGSPKNSQAALKFLENAAISGLTEATVWMYRYATHTKQRIDPDLPISEWLAFLVIFTSGIPSNAYLALSAYNPTLASITATARSKLYNGSTASFENLCFNKFDISRLAFDSGSYNGFAADSQETGAKSSHNEECILPVGFLDDFVAPNVAQDELFENSLLHLLVGSEGSDTSHVHYCIHVLKINKDLRNRAGATPLLMACRAGRQAMILTLLSEEVDVTIAYPGGETPLHWLGLLADPFRVLKEFIVRGADIHAQVLKSTILPGYIGGCAMFYVLGPPLFWAIAMDSDRFVDALLRQGADMHLSCPTGLTAVGFACRPRHWKHLKRLSKQADFKISNHDAFSVLTQWTSIDMLTNFVQPEDQEKCLEQVLSFAMPFQDVTEVEQFYRFLIPHAVSECRVEVLQILLRGLSIGLADLPVKNAEIEEYASFPLSRPTWARHRLVHEATKTGDSDILSCVIDWGGDVCSLDGFGRTPLHTLSFFSDNADCVDILMSHGALTTLDARLEIEEMTAFSNAMACGNFAVADRILSYTPAEERLNILSKHSSKMCYPGLSLMGHFIAWAADLGEKPIQYLLSLQELLIKPDLVFIVDEKRNISALMMACGLKSETAIHNTEVFVASRRRRTMALLIKTFPKKEHLDWRDDFGNTALHIAAYLGAADMASELITAGSGINIVNRGGFTPLDILFSAYPEYLQHETGLKKISMKQFAAGRNYICMMLRRKGGIHLHILSIALSYGYRLPCNGRTEVLDADVSPHLNGNNVSEDYAQNLLKFSGKTIPEPVDDIE